MPLIWRAVLSLFYPPVIIRGKNGKNSESPVGSNKSEKRKPKSAVYRSFWASVVYFHLRLISTRRHEWEMTRNHVICAKNWIFSKWRRIEAVITSSTRNRVVRKGTWVRIPPSPPTTIPRKSRVYAGFLMPFSEWFCPAENRQIRVNGARGALICGALRQTSYTSYS